MKKVALALGLLSGLFISNKAFALNDLTCPGGNCSGQDVIGFGTSTPIFTAVAFIDGSTQTTAGGSGSATLNSWAGGRSTQAIIDLNGAQMIGVSSISTTGSGQSFVITTTGTQIQIFSGVPNSNSSTTITGTTLTFVANGNTFSTNGTSITVNGISISTNTDFFLPINGFSFLGNSSMTVTVGTSVYYNSVVFEQGTSTPGNNFFVTRYLIPPGFNPNLSAILRTFVVAESSGAGGINGNGDALDPASQTYVLSWATAAVTSTANLRTLTYVNSKAFAIAGNTVSGGERWAQNVDLSQLSTDLGPGNCVLFLRVLRDGAADASTALSVFVGGVIEFQRYP